MIKKIILFVSLILLGFVSCSDDKTYEEEIEDPGPESWVKVPEIEGENIMPGFTPLNNIRDKEKRNLLGYGYDITGDFISYKSAKRPILDIERLKKEMPGSLDIHRTTHSDGGISQGVTAREYSKVLTSVSHWDAITNSIPYFQGAIRDNDIFKQDLDSIENYSFASGYVIFINERVSFNAFANELQDYLSQELKNDLNSLTAKQIIHKYGTHVLVNYDLGCRYDLILRSIIPQGVFLQNTISGEKIFSEFDVYYKSKILKEGLRKYLNMTPNWVIGEPDPFLFSQNHKAILQVRVQGKDESIIPSGTYNLQKAEPDLAKLEEWYNGQIDNNPVLVDFKVDRQIPIYELISNGEKQIELKKAFDTYILERQLP